MISHDFRRFLERCYDDAPTHEAWASGLVDVVAPVIAPREGVAVAAVEFACAGADGPGRSSVARHPSQSPLFWFASGRAQSTLSIISVLDDGPPELFERAHRPFLVTSLSRQFGLRSMMEIPFFRQTYGVLGFVGVIGLMARDGTTSVVLTMPVEAGETRSDREPLLYRVRRHLQAGWMGVGRRGPTAGDVIADRHGRLLNPGAEGVDENIKALLRSAASAYDGERRGAMPDPDADRVWRELWRGGWAVVQSVDTDGKRMLLLRRDPSNPQTTLLDPLEQCVLQAVARGAGYKGIACDLGIGVSTASKVVAQALRKLGFTSRVEFVRHLGSSANVRARLASAADRDTKAPRT